MSQDWDVIVLGAGGAGMMCAARAAMRGRRVLALDHGDKLGRKILVSGGGRCNFTNLGAGPRNYFSANEHFAKSALARFRPEDFLALVHKHGVAQRNPHRGVCAKRRAQPRIDGLASLKRLPENGLRPQAWADNAIGRRARTPDRP